MPLSYSLSKSAGLIYYKYFAPLRPLDASMNALPSISKLLGLSKKGHTPVGRTEVNTPWMSFQPAHTLIGFDYLGP